MSVCAERAKRLAALLHAEFGKPAGYRKAALTLRKAIPGDPFGVILLLNVQGSRGNGPACRAYLNVGAHVTGLSSSVGLAKLKEHQCHFRSRVGQHWELTEAPALAALEAVKAEGAEWLDAHRAPLDVIARLEKESGIPGLAPQVHFSTLAEMWAMSGRADKAGELLRARIAWLESERPKANVALVRRLAERLEIDLD